VTLIGIIALMGGSCYDLSAGLARGSAIIAIGVVVAAGTVVGQQPQLQPPTAPRPATASIAGRVVDATTGKPIAGGLLVLRALAS